MPGIKDWKKNYHFHIPSFSFDDKKRRNFEDITYEKSTVLCYYERCRL